jgi:hypothetical protein
LGVFSYYEDIDEDVEDSMKKTSRNVEVDSGQSVILRSPKAQNLLATARSSRSLSRAVPLLGWLLGIYMGRCYINRLPSNSLRFVIMLITKKERQAANITESIISGG